MTATEWRSGRAGQVVADLQAQGRGRGAAGVAGHEQVEGALGRVGVAHQAPLGPDRVQLVGAAGDQLVGIDLVAGVPDQAVLGEVEGQVQRQAELDDAEVAGEVGRAAADDADQLGAHLRGELLELGVRQALQVGRRFDPIRAPSPEASSTIPFQKCQRQAAEPVAARAAAAPAPRRPPRPVAGRGGGCRRRPGTWGTSICPARNPCRRACPAWPRPPGRRAGRPRSGRPGRPPCRSGRGPRRRAPGASAMAAPMRQRGAEQGPGLAAVDRLQLRQRAVGRPALGLGAPLGLEVGHLAGHHPARAGRLGQDPHAPQRRRRRPDLARHDLERQRQEPVAGQDRRRLVERLVAGRPPPPQVVVVHRRQVVVDQANRCAPSPAHRPPAAPPRARRRTPPPPSRRAPAAAASRPPARCAASPSPAAPGTPTTGPTSTSGRYVVSASSTRRRVRSRYSSNPAGSVARVAELVMVPVVIMPEPRADGRTPRSPSSRGTHAPIRSSSPDHQERQGYCGLSVRESPHETPQNFATQSLTGGFG